MELLFEKLESCPVCDSTDIDLSFEKYDRYADHKFGIFKCNYCTLLFVNPRVDRNLLPILYDEPYYKGETWDIATDYHSTYSDPDKMERINRIYTHHLCEIRKFIPKKGIEILDFGCGLGGFSILASQCQMDYKITAIDISPHAIEYVKNHGINGIVGDFSYDFKGKHFHVIYMREVFEHLYDPVDSLTKCKDLLYPGGLLYFTTGNTLLADDLPNWQYIRPVGHLNYFNPKSIKILFDRCSLNSYPREALKISLKKLLLPILIKIGLKKELLPVGYKKDSSM